MSLLTLWQKSQEEIKTKIGSTSYETWFGGLSARETSPEILTIEAPDEFFKNWLIDHYKPLIEEILSKDGTKIDLEFTVNTTIVKSEAQQKIATLEHYKELPTKNPNSLNSRFNFENFVIGPSNRFACAAGLAVAESPSKAYNPLFIYGQVGLGKTHLIQAITYKMLTLYPRLKVCYMTSERFTNELIEAIRNRSTNEFRKRYREADVLLIDDIHFIAGKESTQEEFFHTFNFLHENRKQIIITSDRPPKEINRLEERLISRFAWGLITDVQPPDFETRVAILKKKVEFEVIPVPDDVIMFIAEQIKTNIRELEGALIRVTAYAQLEDRRVTLEMTKMILKDMVKQSIKTISVEMVQKSVAEFFHISLNELRAKRRNKNIVLPRQVAMYLSRKLTNLSLPEIGYAFGGKDHTTVLHSCKKIEKEVAEDGDLKNAVRELTTVLQQ